MRQWSMQEQVAASHSIDKLERQRTLAFRTVKAQVELLDLGLHALRAGRVPVTEEYLERSLHTLRELLPQLRWEG